VKLGFEVLKTIWRINKMHERENRLANNMAIYTRNPTKQV